MSVSRRFNGLISRLNSLKVHFLPSQFNPIGRYSRREYDLARAYVVLAHAELEAYIEDRVTEIAQHAQSVWQARGRHSRVIKNICISHNMRANQPWLPFTRDSRKITSALQSYKALVESNHGIKEVNLLKLVFPLGIQYQSLDAALIDDLDTFGSFRGSIAHSSIKTQQPIDIEGQYKKVQSIIKRLKVFDLKINRLR